MQIQLKRLKFDSATRVAVVCALISVITLGCSSSTRTPDKVQTDSSLNNAPNSTSQQTDLVTAEAIGKVICDSKATRMSSDAELYTTESWECKRGKDTLRIDIFGSSEEQNQANQVVLDYYKGFGDTRSLADLGIICGEKWGIGTDYQETRDALVALLNENGIASSPC